MQGKMDSLLMSPVNLHLHHAFLLLNLRVWLGAVNFGEHVAEGLLTWKGEWAVLHI